MRVGIGIARDQDPSLAAARAVRQARRGVQRPDLALAFARNTASLALLDLAPEGVRAAFGVAHGWDAVGPPVTLTRCQGNKVYEVDGMPAFDYYRQFLGREASDQRSSSSRRAARAWSRARAKRRSPA